MSHEQEEYREVDPVDNPPEQQAPMAATDVGASSQTNSKLAVGSESHKTKKEAANLPDLNAHLPASHGVAVVRKPPKVKKFRDLRWSGAATGRMFKLMTPDNRMSWKLAYTYSSMRLDAGHELMSFRHWFLSDSAYWGSGMLMPGLTQDGGIHIWLYHLHYCVRNSYDVRHHAQTFKCVIYGLRHTQLRSS
jgi:hypothetical protein